MGQFTAEAIHKGQYLIPCRIGDTVWGLVHHGSLAWPKKGVVSHMCFVRMDSETKMRLSITVRGVCCGEWGKRIFPTEEEARAYMNRQSRYLDE